MLTHTALLHYVRQGNWFTSVDLQDASQKVPEIRFSGLDLRRRRCIHLATYIDDWLLAAQSEQEAREHTRLLTEHLSALGFRELLDKGKAFSTIKVYLAAVSSCHVGFNGTTVGQHP
ncbi:hypothetical protein SRHO_G00290520 [Serrasalmus rhombeus]